MLNTKLYERVNVGGLIIVIALNDSQWQSNLAY